jgi:hypothetical protein
MEPELGAGAGGSFWPLGRFIFWEFVLAILGVFLGLISANVKGKITPSLFGDIS